jgi:hypothetical protein
MKTMKESNSKLEMSENLKESKLDQLRIEVE